jgi:hypothetical protein
MCGEGQVSLNSAMRSFHCAGLGLSLALLAVSASAQATPSTRPVSKSVNVAFKGVTKTLTVEQLLALPQVTVKVHNVQVNADETYSGPLLSDVLETVDFRAEREQESTILHSSVVATGNFRFFVIYSGAEVQPTYSKSKVIVAVMKAGLPNTDGGVIELVNTGDANSNRWLRGLTDLTVMTLAPTVQKK